MSGPDSYLHEKPWLDALDRAARYYREALKEIIDECSHDDPRIGRIRERAESGIRAADYELEQVRPRSGEQS